MEIWHLRRSIMSDPLWLHADGIALDYQRDLRKLVKKMRDDTEAILLPWIATSYDPIKQDSLTDDLATVLMALLAALTPTYNSTIERLEHRYSVTNQWSIKRYSKLLKSWQDRKLTTVNTVALSGVDVFKAEPWLKDLSKVWIARNSSLIKSIPAQYHAKISDSVLDAVTKGTSRAALSAEIQSLYKVTKKRADLIAIDQISKLSSVMEEQRMMAIGAMVYRWKTMQDERVRHVHVQRDGRYYDARKTQGHAPSQEIRCRCYRGWVHPDEMPAGVKPRGLASTSDY